MSPWPSVCSIGSLGIGGTTFCVQDITIRNSVLTGTTNGLRIKTYQGGKGAVFNVKYENITMNNVQHPIILNQVRCFLTCSSVTCPCVLQKRIEQVVNNEKYSRVHPKILNMARESACTVTYCYLNARTMKRKLCFWSAVASAVLL